MGNPKSMEMFDARGKNVEAVYRIDLDGKVGRIIDKVVERPNGVLVSAGDRYLYVADNNNDSKGGVRENDGALI